MQISMKAARVNAGLRQKEAAEQLGVSNKTLINWEKGLSYPRIDQFQKLAALYGVTVDDIFLPVAST